MAGARERRAAVHIGGQQLLSRSVHVEQIPAGAPGLAGIIDRVNELLLVDAPELRERPFQESAGQGDDATVCDRGDATVDSTGGIDQREAGIRIAGYEVRHHAGAISDWKPADARG